MFFFSFFYIVAFNSPPLSRRKLNLLSTYNILRMLQNTTPQYDCEIAMRDIKKIPACQWQKSNFRSQRNSLNISSSNTWASWIPLRELYKRQIAPKMELCCYVLVETIRSAFSNRDTVKNRLQGLVGGEVRWLVFHSTALYPRIKLCKPVDL